MGLKKSFISFFQRFFKQEIVKVFSLNSISTLVRMLTGLISVKMVASIIGPAGIALVGQLNNFSTIVLGLSNGGINSGITKYVAEFKDSGSDVKRILSNAMHITIICTFIISSLLIVLHNQLSKWIMLSSDYGYIFLIFGFTIFLYTLNAFLISVLNGLKEFKKYVIVNIAGTIVGLFFTVLFVITLGLPGALISAVTYQSVVVIITFFLLRKRSWLQLSYYKERIDFNILRGFFKFSLMSIVSISLNPISQMILRGYVISQISPNEAGWWEGMNRLSNMYLSVITASFSIYYLPRLSEIKDRLELRKEIIKSYKLIIPFLIIGLFFVYFFRMLIINIIFTSAFLPMENLFIWQILGDLFKISGWLLAYLLVAKAMMKEYILLEICFSALFLFLSFFLLKRNGIVGITQAYLTNYIVYFITMIILFRKLLFNRV